MVVKVIHNITKLRYKANGDASGMLAFFQINNINKILLMRYVGNRFHELFELSRNIYFLKDHLKRYLKDSCSRGKTYRNNIANYLGLEHVERALAIGGLFGKCLTGPWMSVLYRKVGLSNLQTCAPLSYMVGMLTELVAHPRLLWDRDFVCFDGFDSSTHTQLSQSVHECLVGFPVDECALQLTSRIAAEFLVVVKRQAECYLPGGTVI